MDYYAVDPESGTWEDVEALGRNFEMMFDAVFNHASAQGDWFKNSSGRSLAGRQRFSLSRASRILPMWCVPAPSRC